MPKCNECTNDFPNWIEIDGKNRNLSSRKYCLDCVPFGTTGRQHSSSAKEKNTDCKFCPNKTVKGRTLCPSCVTKVRRFRAKSAAIKYLGGKCIHCEWQGHIAGYQFHHRSDKEFQISGSVNKSWDVLKAELDKCDLLCATCHMIHHADDLTEEFIDYATNEYNGRLLDF